MAIAIPANGAWTFLTHFFRSCRANETYVVERFKAMEDGDIRRSANGPPVALMARRPVLAELVVFDQRMARRDLGQQPVQVLGELELGIALCSSRTSASVIPASLDPNRGWTLIMLESAYSMIAVSPSRVIRTSSGEALRGLLIRLPGTIRGMWPHALSVASSPTISWHWRTRMARTRGLVPVLYACRTLSHVSATRLQTMVNRVPERPSAVTGPSPENA